MQLPGLGLAEAFDLVEDLAVAAAALRWFDGLSNNRVVQVLAADESIRTGRMVELAPQQAEASGSGKA